MALDGCAACGAPWTESHRTGCSAVAAFSDLSGESDAEFTDRVIRESRAMVDRVTVRGGDGAAAEDELGREVWRQLSDPEVIAALTPTELRQVVEILRGVLERKRRGL